MNEFCCVTSFTFQTSNLLVGPAGKWYTSTSWLGSLRLRNVAVFICRGLAALNVLLVNEHFDALLDHADTWVEPGFGLIDDLHIETKCTTVIVVTNREGQKVIVVLKLNDLR